MEVLRKQIHYGFGKVWKQRQFYKQKKNLTKIWIKSCL